MVGFEKFTPNENDTILRTPRAEAFCAKCVAQQEGAESTTDRTHDAVRPQRRSGKKVDDQVFDCFRLFSRSSPRALIISSTRLDDFTIS